MTSSSTSFRACGNTRRSRSRARSARWPTLVRRHLLFFIYFLYLLFSSRRQSDYTYFPQTRLTYGSRCLPHGMRRAARSCATRRSRQDSSSSILQRMSTGRTGCTSLREQSSPLQQESRNLKFIIASSEPEAAAVHCAHLTNLHQLRPSQNFMICDAGGGTVVSSCGRK